MSDRIPGSAYSNPLWHRGYRIYVSDSPLPSEGYFYAHDDWEPDTLDGRFGYAGTVDQAKGEIDALEAEDVA